MSSPPQSKEDRISELEKSVARLLERVAQLEKNEYRHRCMCGEMCDKKNEVKCCCCRAKGQGHGSFCPECMPRWHEEMERKRKRDGY